MNQRRKTILKYIIQNYINNGVPVASATLANFLNYSPATIRNEMAILENEQYLYQPHVSSGRIPTAKGYYYYINNLMGCYRLSKKIHFLFNEYINGQILEKDLIRHLSLLTKTIIIYTNYKGDIYYTGISNLFSQPEFTDHTLVCKISTYLDNMEEFVFNIKIKFPRHTKKPYVYIGDDKMVPSLCSLLVDYYKPYKRKKTGILALVGPMRMNYAKNFAILNNLKKVLSLNS